MSLQQFLELADCRVGLTQWSRQTVPESGSSDLEGPVTEACVSVRDHTGGHIRWAKPTAANIWDKLAVIGQVARCWTIQRLIAPVVTTTSVILSSNKIQNGDILVPAYPDCPGRWLLNDCCVVIIIITVTNNQSTTYSTKLLTNFFVNCTASF